VRIVAVGALISARDKEAMMADDDLHTGDEPLDYAGAIGKLTDLVGRDVLVELRVGGLSGPCRLAARGVVEGPPSGQLKLTARRSSDDDLEAFLLDTGAFLTVKEQDFVGGQWHAGADDGQQPTQPHLNLVFTDSVLHIAVVWRNDPTDNTVH
jgi:hypothetical protein